MASTVLSKWALAMRRISMVKISEKALTMGGNVGRAQRQVERQYIWGASPSTSEAGRRWQDPETAGEEHCTERMVDTDGMWARKITALHAEKSKDTGI